MKIVYSRQALADLKLIAEYYAFKASPTIAGSIGRRIEQVIGRIAAAPLSGTRLSQRSNIRTTIVVRYPFRIFYRVGDMRIDILHIRHTSRRPLRAE